MAVRGNRPFSLDDKIPDLDRYLPAGRKVCEFRLLAIEKDFRGGPVLFLMMKKMAQYCMKEGYDYAIISGTTRQQKLYHHLGFEPFYPKVGAQRAKEYRLNKKKGRSFSEWNRLPFFRGVPQWSTSSFHYVPLPITLIFLSLCG